MTRARRSEGWAVDKLRMVSQIKPKYRKWTPGVTATIDRDKYNGDVINPYDYEPLQYKAGLLSAILERVPSNPDAQNGGQLRGVELRVIN